MIDSVSRAECDRSPSLNSRVNTHSRTHARAGSGILAGSGWARHHEQVRGIGGDEFIEEQGATHFLGDASLYQKRAGIASSVYWPVPPDRGIGPGRADTMAIVTDRSPALVTRGASTTRRPARLAHPP
jgi:hypothetical protein